MNDRKLNLSVAAAVLSAVPVVSMAAETPAMNTPHSANGTANHVVLVHGAWMGAWSWNKVATDLRRHGLDVTVVELPGHGDDNTPPDKLTLDGYAKAVEASFPKEGKVVLVGHSMAGMVISAVAQHVPQRLSRLVYVAAYLPRNGESLYQLSSSDSTSLVNKYWREDDPKSYSPATIASDGIAEVFCADCSAADKAMLVSRHKPEAVPPMATPVTLTADKYGTVPRTYVHTVHDNAVTYTLQKTMVSRAGGNLTEVDLDSSHAPMLSHPDALAEIIATSAK